MAKISLKFVSFALLLLFLLIFSLAYSAAAGFESNLYFGLRDNGDVLKLQQFLTDKGFYNGPVNGNFLALTKSAVIKFQKDRGITPAGGYVGPKTREILNKELSAVPAAPTTPDEINKLINTLLEQVKALEAQLAASKEKEVQAAPPAPAPIVIPPAPVVKTVLDSSLKINVNYPSVTVTTLTNVTLTEFKLADDIPSEQVALSRLKFTNNGTLTDFYFTDIRLINSKNGMVVARADIKDGAIEFKLTKDSSKLDNGLLLSNNTYSVMASFITPNTTNKPTVRLDFVSASDIDAFDYNDLGRSASATKLNIFPVEGPRITISN